MMIHFLLALSAFVAASQQARGQTSDAPQSGALAIYRADGDALDSSGHDNYGEYLGTARYAPGLAGEAFDFDGEESYVATPLRVSPDDVSDTTWTVWARPRRNDSRRLLLEADDAGFDRFITIENGFWGIGTGRGIWCPAEAKLGAWQHLAVVFARDSIRFYVNGQEYICPDAPVGQESQTKLRIGGSPLWKQFFDGLADEVEIYDRALGADEIKAIYEKLRPAAESSRQECAGSARVENNAIAAERPADQPPAAPDAQPTPPKSELSTGDSAAPAPSAPFAPGNRATLLNPVEIPIMVGGKQAGRASVPENSEVSVLEVVGARARVKARVGEAWVDLASLKPRQTEAPAVPPTVATPPPKPLLRASASPPRAPAAGPDLTYRTGGPLSKPLSLSLLGNDLPAVVSVLLAERWNNPVAANAVDFAMPRTKDEIGKEWPGVRLSDFRGSPLLMLFYSEGQNANPNSDQAKALELLAKISETPAASAQLGLKCVVVTPYDAASIKKSFESRGIRVSVINDPTDEVRRQMKLYSLPMVLLDKNGAIVWHNRVGQRGQRPPGADGLFRFDSGDLNVALKALSSGALKYEKSTPPIRRPKPAVEELSAFEDGLSGWHLIGDAWGEDGVASEKGYPGLVKGYQGARWLSSFFGNGINGTGLAVSPEFVIAKRYLHFTVGGGDLRQSSGVALVCNETTVQLASGENTFEMKPVAWDLGNYLGKKARLIVYDTGRSEQRDGIMVDGFTLSESAQLPETFADLHDPNNPDHARRVAKDLPEDWRELQAGKFHISVRPGQTFRLERMYQIQALAERPFQFVYEFEAFPNTVAQTIHQQSMEVRDAKRGFSSAQQPTGKAIADKVLVAEVRPSEKDEKKFPVRHQMLATANMLTLERGRPADFQPLPDDAVRALTKAPGDLEDHREFQDAVAREGLERWPDESEPAYLLRCWRWLQRYWTDFQLWGGWPISNRNALPVVQEWERKSMSCPAVGAITMLMRKAGIPAIDGQGFWANDNGDICLPHVRSLVFLDQIGWVHLDDHKYLGGSLGPFNFGSNWGNNYFQAVHDHSPHYKAREKPETTGQPGETGGDTWWRSWRGLPPDGTPL